MSDSIYQCYRCETLLPEGKLDKLGNSRTCKDAKECAKRKAKLIEMIVTEEPYDGRRDHWGGR